jgi:hypothetical protein
MQARRLVWGVIIALFVMMVFAGGFVIGRSKAVRAQYAGLNGVRRGISSGLLGPSRVTRPGVPFNRISPFGFGPRSRMQPGFGYAPRSRIRQGFGMGSGLMHGGRHGAQVRPGYAPRGQTKDEWHRYGRLPNPQTPRQIAPGDSRGRRN